MNHCDTLIRGAAVIDGTKAPRRIGDIAIAGDRIAAIGKLDGWAAAREIDASGLVAAPGFIDVHTHDDRLLLADPTMAPKASQGVTTVITGNCGVSLAPLVADAVPPPLDLINAPGAFRYRRFAEYFEDIEGHGTALNAAALVGHSTLRVGAMDRLDRPANAAEIARMTAVAVDAVKDGAVGLSTGLFYPPASAAPTEEVIAIAKPLQALGALYVTHMREEANHVHESLAETFRIGREAGLPAVISHHKVVGLANHGRSRETLALISDAMRHQDIGLDAYPYVASSTILRVDHIAFAAKVLVTWSKTMPQHAGRDLKDIATEMGVSAQEAGRRLLPAGAIYFSMDEADVSRILAFPDTMIGSDGLPHDEHPHPRLWGTFPRVLGHYARDMKLFDLETAVHKMTGLSARRFGLKDRGVLTAGAFADVTLFNPATVIDSADFDHPITPARGIVLTMVNGIAVWRDGRATGDKPGRVLRRGDL